MPSAGRSCDPSVLDILEIVQTRRDPALANRVTIVARNDLLFTMSEITQAYPHGPRLRIDASRTVLQAQARRLVSSSLDLRSSLAPHHAHRAKVGGGRRDRTDDLMLAKHALSQLSYAPVTRRRMLDRTQKTKGTPGELVGLGRLELPTSRLSSARSNQLSYKPLNDERLACAHLNA